MMQKRKFNHFSLEERERLFSMYLQGMSYRSIGEVLVSFQVSKFLEIWKDRFKATLTKKPKDVLAF